jgi:hypothetical protein
VAQLGGTQQRRLLMEERSRNALGLARAFIAHGERWRSVMTVCKSLRLGWRYPHWWYGAAKELVRACIPDPRGVAKRARARAR